MSSIDFTVSDEMIAGYSDGIKSDTPEPSSNRTHCYRHGFAVGRADRHHEPAFGGADQARQAAKTAIEKDNGF